MHQGDIQNGEQLNNEQPFLEYNQWAERIHRDGFRKAIDSPDYIAAKEHQLDQVAPAPKSDSPPKEHQDKSTLMHLLFFVALIGFVFIWNYDGATLVITEGILIASWIYMGHKKSVELKILNEPLETYRKMSHNRDVQSRTSDRRVQHQLDQLWADYGDVPLPLSGTDPTFPKPEPDSNFTANKAGPLILSWMQCLGAANPQLDRTEEGTTTVYGAEYLVMIDHERVPVTGDQVLSIFKYRGSKNWYRKRPIFFSRSGYSKEAIDLASQHGISLFLYSPEAGTIDARSENARYILEYGMTSFLNGGYAGHFFDGLLDAPVPFSAADRLWVDVPEDVARVADWLQLASGSEPEVLFLYSDLVFLNAPGISALIQAKNYHDLDTYGDYLADYTAETYAVLVPPGNTYVAFANSFRSIHDMGDENAEENKWYDSENYRIGAINLRYSKMDFEGVNKSGKAALIAASKRRKPM